MLRKRLVFGIALAALTFTYSSLALAQAGGGGASSGAGGSAGGTSGAGSGGTTSGAPAANPGSAVPTPQTPPPAQTNPGVSPAAPGPSSAAPSPTSPSEDTTAAAPPTDTHRTGRSAHRGRAPAAIAGAWPLLVLTTIASWLALGPATNFMSRPEARIPAPTFADTKDAHDAVLALQFSHLSANSNFAAPPPLAWSVFCL